MNSELHQTILVLGGTKYQLRAVEYLREIGQKSIVVDKDPNCFLSGVADEFYPIDLKDKAGLLELAVAKKIKGAMTLQSDVGIPAIGYINQTMKLKGIDSASSLNCTNKILMRKALSRNSIRQPKYRIITEASQILSLISEIEFPIMVKTPQNSGSRGIYRIDSKQNLENFFELNYRKESDYPFLVEEFIVGTEFGAQGFFSNGKLIFLAPHNDTLGGLNNLIPIGHSFPLKLDYPYKLIWDFAEKVGLTLGIFDGPANFDFILAGENLYVIEVGARIGATGLPELVNAFYGVDLIALHVSMFFDNFMEIETEFKFDAIACRILEATQGGVIKKIENFDTFLARESILELNFDVTRGSLVNKMSNGRDRIGIVMTKGKSVEESEKEAYLASSKISRLVEIESYE